MISQLLFNRFILKIQKALTLYVCYNNDFKERQILEWYILMIDFQFKINGFGCCSLVRCAKDFFVTRIILIER